MVNATECLLCSANCCNAISAIYDAVFVYVQGFPLWLIQCILSRHMGSSRIDMQRGACHIDCTCVHPREGDNNKPAVWSSESGHT